MMKFFRQTLYKVLLTAVFAAVFMAPFAAEAFEKPILCVQTGTIKRQLEKTIEKTSSSYALDNDTRLLSFTKKSKDQVSAVERARSQTDVAWKAYLLDLNKKAKTLEARQAVATFKARVEAAREAQYRADDAASREFTEGVKKLIAERKSETLALSSGFKSDTAKVLDDATILCATDKNVSKATEQVNVTLAQYKRAFIEKIQNHSAFDAKLSALQSTKEEKRAAAQGAFKAVLAEAFTNLQSVLH